MGGLPVKPKLQGYVQQELFDEFERFRATYNLNQSKALEKLLAEYFGKPSAFTLPPGDAITIAALRSELVEWKIDLTQRLQALEDRLAGSSAVSSVTLLDGLAEVSATELAVDKTGLADSSADESAVAEDATVVPVDVSAISSVDELATPLDELVARLADESADESAVEEEAIEEEAIEEAVEKEGISATELAPLLGVTQPTVSRAAMKLDHEKFMKWSKKKDSAGRTWDFILVKKGGKEVPQFFTRY